MVNQVQEHLRTPMAGTEFGAWLLGATWVLLPSLPQCSEANR